MCSVYCLLNRNVCQGDGRVREITHRTDKFSVVKPGHTGCRVVSSRSGFGSAEDKLEWYLTLT